MKFDFKSLPTAGLTKTEDWFSWKWQLKTSLKTKADFEAFFELSPEEAEAFKRSEGLFQIRVTPYYAKLASDEKPGGPLRRILMPHLQEFKKDGMQMFDPLGERKHSPLSRIIHRYPDRVLFLVTDICSVYCRYCTRKHFTGQDQAFIKGKEYQEALEYIKNAKGIREVILSGGDPLTLADEKLETVLSDLRKIDHVELIRIGTRMPVVNPMRITQDLVNMMKKYHPVYIMNHFNHPKELTREAANALTLLADNGFPLFNQLVLLNGVNNHPAIVQALSRRLLYLRVKPYYMFQCDPSEGTDHLRTSIEESLQIQRELWGRMSGLAMPNLSLDIPGGGGKVGLVPNFELSANKDGRTYKGWDGIQAEYTNPAEVLHHTPDDFSNYTAEWEELKDQHYGSSAASREALELADAPLQAQVTPTP